MKTVAVTGAAGRLGGNLVPALLARGYAVRGLVLPDDPKRGKLDRFDIEVVEGDVRDEAVCRRLLDGVDGVVHTANLVGIPAGMGRDTFFDINVKGTLAVVEAAAARADSLERFVHVSSDAVYPMGNHDSRPDYTPIDEGHPKRPIGLYALTKALNEQTADSFRASHGLQTSMIRPAGMFAGAEVLGRWTVGFVLGLMRGAVNNPRCGLYHPDLADTIATLESAAAPDDLCAVRDTEGRPWLYSPADARDVAHGSRLRVCAGTSGGRGRGVQRRGSSAVRLRRGGGVSGRENRATSARVRCARAVGVLVRRGEGALADRVRSSRDVGAGVRDGVGASLGGFGRCCSCVTPQRDRQTRRRGRWLL
jgi:nucleoside-diphosphate-sugar epimerase